MAQKAVNQDSPPHGEAQGSGEINNAINNQFKNFIALPTELRVKIFEMALCKPYPLYPEFFEHWVPSDNCRPCGPYTVGLLRMSRQVAVESTQLFYGGNTFNFVSIKVAKTPSKEFVHEGSSIILWLREIGLNAAFVQNIDYRFYPTDDVDVDAAKFEIGHLHHLVPGLRRLTIFYNPNHIAEAFFLSKRRHPDYEGKCLFDHARGVILGEFSDLEELRIVQDR
ncbi:hypothetical protein VTJ49DRAFT_4619 [Mycothermus thermophilus]|uniref:Uncharacterized protein n=1 Tax=Humicola insolens TaxID=85995 RepID=A0ABR3V4X6_HUMIN